MTTFQRIFKISILASGCINVDGTLELSSINLVATDMPLEVQNNIGDHLNVETKINLRTSCKNGTKVFATLALQLEELRRIVNRTDLDSNSKELIMGAEAKTMTRSYPYIHHHRDLVISDTNWHLLKESIALLKVLNSLKKNRIDVNELPEDYRLLYEWDCDTATYVLHYFNMKYTGYFQQKIYMNRVRPPYIHNYYYHTSATVNSACTKSEVSGNDFNWTEKVMETWRAHIYGLDFIRLDRRRGDHGDVLVEIRSNCSVYRSFFKEYRKYITSNGSRLECDILRERLEAVKEDIIEKIVKLEAFLDRINK